MIYQDFLNFHKITPGSKEGHKPSSYSELFSSGLTEIIDKYGFCEIDKGLAWLVSPERWQGVLNEFLDARERKSSIPFMRSAFGDIFYITGDQSIWRIDPLIGKITYVTDSLDSFFIGLLAMKAYFENAFLKDLFRQALKKLGKIDSDEIYGFEPLLSLGGSENVENIVKVKAREHLSLIAQTL